MQCSSLESNNVILQFTCLWEVMSLHTYTPMYLEFCVHACCMRLQSKLWHKLMQSWTNGKNVHLIYMHICSRIVEWSILEIRNTIAKSISKYKCHFYPLAFGCKGYGRNYEERTGRKHTRCSSFDSNKLRARGGEYGKKLLKRWTSLKKKRVPHDVDEEFYWQTVKPYRSMDRNVGVVVYCGSIHKTYCDYISDDLIPEGIHLKNHTWRVMADVLTEIKQSPLMKPKSGLGLNIFY